MRKLLVLVMAAALLGFSANASAEGDFEISGHINTGFGWQYNGKAWASGLLGAFTEEGMIPTDFSVNDEDKLTNNNTWLFYVGDVELDITKTFGENIRLRTDLDFLRNLSNSYYGGFSANQMIEQAYVTVNIPVGYGMEFLVGRFNAPMGFEAVDVNDNDLPFHSLIFNFLRPQNLTGIKFYYPFSDLVDLHIWIANSLRDTGIMQGGLEGSLPVFGLRLGFTWGQEGQENTLGLSGAAGTEASHSSLSSYNNLSSCNNGDKYGDLSYLADVDFNIWVTDAFAIGGEAFFRSDGAANKATLNNAAKRIAYYYAGLVNLHYVFSDVWDGTLRYTFARDVRGNSSLATVDHTPAASQYNRYGGYEDKDADGKPVLFGQSALGGYTASFHQADLGFNYHITDGAKIMAMYRFEIMRPDKAGASTRTYENKLKQGMAHTVAANFAYEF